MEEIREMSIVLKPIGIIKSPFKVPKGTPIQPPAAKGVRGSVEIFPEYAEGLKDLDGFSHVILLYYFHLSGKPSMIVKPFMDDEEHGVFATRAPSRPNPIGLSVVRLISIEGNVLQVEDLDVVNGTPLLDIKPYVPEFDAREEVRRGWLEKNLGRIQHFRDDGRFTEIR